MSGKKCQNCGSTDIEVDTARGDAVCTNCGSVLEDNIIVAEVQFEENAHGGSTALGKFVSAESKGGATGYGASFVGIGTESREITLRRARQGITQLCQQLHLNNHCIEMACNFFKMALARQLTRGRSSTHVHAACVYMTCRTEGTAHLLIDISDVLQICCYELGRIYLKISQALCIKIPSIDPCLYILRFANKLEFGDKTHEVSTTALRLVQRMKRDSIHSGRRPSGLCGAALLIAARMHDFNRVPADVVRIVKVHETTIRKRLMEFGDTPSSSLTLDEFMTIDLESEQDPPAFKAARKKDKDRLAKFQEENNEEFTELQKEINRQIELRTKKRKRLPQNLVGEVVDNLPDQNIDTNTFINQCTMNVIEEIINDDEINLPQQKPSKPEGLPPNIAHMLMTPDQVLETEKKREAEQIANTQFDLESIDDADLDQYILSAEEAKSKEDSWNKINKNFLLEQEARRLKAEQEKEQGKPEKKKRKSTKKKSIGPSATAAEAIEKMLQEKKISSKINYDILKSLTQSTLAEDSNKQGNELLSLETFTPVIKSYRTPSSTSTTTSRSRSSKRTSTISKADKRTSAIDFLAVTPAPVEQVDKPCDQPNEQPDDLEDDYYEPEPEPAAKPEEHSSLASMLNQGDGDEYDYEDDY
uniref:B-related factor 1 n=1 Tax=Xenopsylla cheopis TaxID=163159 RepID=A0A6M2DIB7_XENCH